MSIEIPTDSNFWVAVGSVVVAVSTAVLASITYKYMKETRGIRGSSERTAAAQESAALAQQAANKAQENFYKLSAMTEIFKLLGSDEFRKARMYVFEGYRQVKSGSKDYFNKNEPHKSSALKVRGALDDLGTLFINGLLPKDEFLEVYFMVVLTSWVCLEDFIKEERTKRGDTHYSLNFEKLKDAAEAYRLAHYPKIEVKPF